MKVLLLLFFALTIIYEPYNMTDANGDLLCAKYWSKGVISKYPNPDPLCEGWLVHEEVHSIFSQFSIGLKQHVIDLWHSEELFVLHYQFSYGGVFFDG